MGIKPKQWNRPTEGEIVVSLESMPDKIRSAMSQGDLDELQNNLPERTARLNRQKAKLHYMPGLEDILGESPVEKERLEREARKAHDRKMAEQARRDPFKAEKARLRNKKSNAWRELFLELKVREAVVDEYYRKRYENEIVTLQKQLESMREYIGSYDPKHRYPSPRIFEKAVRNYFSECDLYESAYTVPDLLLFLAMTKAQWRTILNQGPHDYTVVAEMAMLKIEGQRNRQLLTGKGQMSGHIADLNHHFDWSDKKEEAQPKTVNNLVIMGAPPEPKSIEEWADWYNKSIGGKRADELEAVDVTPEQP